MMIGQFSQDGDGYVGDMIGLGLKVASITFSPVPARQGSGPDFVVLGNDEDGRQYEITAAWKRVSEKKGKPYLSVKLDGPTLAAPVHCALIEQQDGTYGLIWNREDRKAEAEKQAAAWPTLRPVDPRCE
jgi:uncharacterized protein (DUF736 family)